MSIHESRGELPPCSHAPPPYNGPSRDDVLALRREFVSPGVFTYYKEPLQIAAGHRQYLWDETGKRYLDALAGIVTVSVGHCHPKIVEAVRDQAGALMHTTTIYLHPTIGQLAKALAEKFPAGSDLSSTYFTNSGSEANDLATLMARLHSSSFDIISLQNGYHGGSQTTMGLTGMSNWKFPLPQAFGVHHAAPAYCYRCPFSLEFPSCDLRCARSVEQLIEHETSGKVAAFIAEPIQGAGGVVDPPDDYFKIVYEIIRAHRGLCISDEVQTGFGRLGSHYWGFDAYGVVPDMVVMAKGIANGAPLGAVTTRRPIAECLTQKLHFNTFAGNPLTMIQGVTTLEIIDEESLQANAREIGGYLKERLVALQDTHELIGDVRGRGLLLGVELVRDRKTKEHATEETIAILEGAKDRGLLIGRGGVRGNVLRIKPPLCITKEDVDFLIDQLDATMTALNL